MLETVVGAQAEPKGEALEWDSAAAGNPYRAIELREAVTYLENDLFLPWLHKSIVLQSLTYF
ncbi:hypothetical protein [Paenibacillus thiaminolyticus]|uniref:Uncharacterized protein n=1 Tax=Paenibacillus thiaminolyticus TaxID=49283 RepID=A0A3A3GMK5_PANTH|nr:hypothetical protein [Paenibacillus thiaminolyticus]RJG26530.1 hypothetical protein DQX05_00310 [Paenibacillus thiaminolyticus]